MTSPRKPDLILKIKDHKGKSANVGAAWKSEAGHIGLQLNPGVVLDWRALDGCILTLFPNDAQ
jgi:hypothetical protein